MQRNLEKYIHNDLKTKMVLLGGPRQVGKTTLAKNIGENYFDKSFKYYNWDFAKDKKEIKASQIPADTKLIIYDEIHKYRGWKNFLKGMYDTYKDTTKFIAAGSARLNLYRKGGDSLLGRYHYYRLHPLSLAEVLEIDNSFDDLSIDLKFHNSNPKNQQTIEELFKFGGFPEIFLEKSEQNLRRWHSERKERLIKEDIRDISLVKDVSILQNLSEMLPSRVGSLLSMNTLSQDLQISFKTIRHWIEVFENFYYAYRIYPYASKKIKSLKKMGKLYLWDWSEVEDTGARYENIIASHLLKYAHFLKDNLGYNAEVNFVRDLEEREIDFMVSIDQKPLFAVEAKYGQKEVSRELLYLKKALGLEKVFVVVMEPDVDYLEQGVRIISASKFLTALF